MKKFLFIIIVGALIAGGNSGCKNKSNKGNDTATVCLTVDSFLLSPEKWAGKDVTIKGTVSHVCRHSGKKLFLFSADPEKTVKVNASGNVSSFDIKYEGTDLEITGTVVEDQKIDANYLDEWEKEIKSSLGEKEVGACNAESKAMKGQNKDKAGCSEKTTDPYADVKEFRSKLEKSGKAYISIYAINIKSLKELSKKE